MNNIFGVLLVGGKSSRMGQNKAQLKYRDIPEYLRLSNLLDSVCSETLLCHPADQEYGVPFIEDPGQGPLAAINATFKAYPDRPLLVVACDLPLLERATLDQLIANRDPSAHATAFRSPTDDLPEPLCTIYEPTIATLIESSLEAESHCPRHLLTEANTHLIDLLISQALQNANTPADTLEIRAHLTDSKIEKTITLRYFAQHKEISGTDSETITTSSVTPSGLYEELKAKHKLPHKQKHLMLAINGDFADWATPLKEGDEIAYLPPVAGG